MVDDKVYQRIYDKLDEFLLPGWGKLIVYLEYGKESYTFSFYEKIKKRFINGYDLPGVTEEKIDASFREIDKLILKERKKEKNNLWTNMTMIVTSTGNMKADFDYTDLSEGTYLYKKNWKKRYLK